MLEPEASILQKHVTIEAQLSNNSVNEYVKDFIHFDSRRINSLLLRAHETREGQIIAAVDVQADFPVNKVSS
jgi:hypothetical protein